MPKAREGNFFEENLASPGMPPTTGRPRPRVTDKDRPQSAGKRASLFAKYGRIGEGFKKFQDNVKHLQTPTPPKPKGTRPARSNKVLPISPDVVVDAVSPLVPSKANSFLSPQEKGEASGAREVPAR